MVFFKKTQENNEENMSDNNANRLRVKDIGINTYRENIIYMHSDCPVCRSEGFSAMTRLEVSANGKSIIATLNVIESDDIITRSEAALSTVAMERLQVRSGAWISVDHLRPVASLSKLRTKMFGNDLTQEDYLMIMKDVVAGRYSNIELAAFVTACAGDKLTLEEITGLTKAMVSTGHQLSWNKKLILDKHSVGGLPGNRTTPIIVSIVAAAGLTIPKTSSKAIISPAGSADTMATLTEVNLSIDKIKEVVDKEGGCLAWGGAVGISPADDILIPVEKALDVDSEGQMIASVLSKKAAAGSTHVLIDIPVGPTAKVRTHEEALRLQYYFIAVGEALNLKVEVNISDGTQPVGRGIGPALEAMDILSVLRNEEGAPEDLRKRSVILAGKLLEMGDYSLPGKGVLDAEYLIRSGKALQKLQSICLSQGKLTEPLIGKYSYDVISEHSGIVKQIDNRRIARIAKLAGAPKAPSAGIRFHSPLEHPIEKGDILFTIFAETQGELDYSKDYLFDNNNPITIKNS